MMQKIIHPERQDWKTILQRPYVDNRAVLDTVQQVIEEVKEKGDEALKQFSQKWDGVVLSDLKVSEEEISDAQNSLSTELKEAIKQAKSNIELFHKGQLKTEEAVETMPGIECWRRSIGIEAVGLYIPGGTAPLFSTVLMLGVPASIAGCKRVVLCTPAGKNGSVHPAILYAAQQVGIIEIYKIGGAQAIAALAMGTETIRSVHKIFGPGNQYVTAAKQAVQQLGVAIDMPAGPSEVCVLADGTANASFVAADLLSQAEHGTDSQVLLVTTNEELVSSVMAELQHQLARLPRKKVAEKALANSKAIVVKSVGEAIDFIDEYAAEHLILNCANADAIADRITNAGSIFIGAYSPESVGDYASGTNHTLPTAGFAKAYSGVSVDSFVKKITYQRLSKNGLTNISETVMIMAEAEGLQAHANAVKVRLSAD